MNSLDCLICYDFQDKKGEMVYLACSHSLCKDCLSKLRCNACPFCRTVINREVYTDVSTKNTERTVIERIDNLESVYQQSIRIRVRRRRRRTRTTTEQIDSTLGIIRVEATQQAKRRKKERQPKRENWKKGKWGRGKWNRQSRVRTR